MPAYNETAIDLDKKYLSSYILYDGEVVLCRGFEQEDDGIVGQFQRSDAKEGFFMCKVDPKLFQTIDLDSHYFNLPVEVVDTYGLTVMGWKFVRRARRQNRKGISNETAYLTSFMQAIIQSTGRHWVSLGFGFKTIETMRKPTYPQYLEALDLCDKAVSVAVSPDFAVALSPMHKDAYLMASKFGWIGTCTDKVIDVHHLGSYQEVCDFVRRNNLSLEVNLCHK